MGGMCGGSPSAGHGSAAAAGEAGAEGTAKHVGQAHKLVVSQG